MTRTKIWRRSLVAALITFLLFALLYTLKLVEKVSHREKQNATIWIHTIKQQRNLISNIELLFTELDNEEQKKLKLWAKAVKRLPLIENNDQDFPLIFDLVKNNETIPAILTDKTGRILYTRNIKDSYKTTPLDTVLASMSKLHHPIKIDLPDMGINYLYYSESKIHHDINYVFTELLTSYLNDIENNVVSVPVLYMDSTKTKILASGNFRKNANLSIKKQSLEDQIATLQQTVTPIQIGNEYLFIEETDLLLMVKFFPIVFIILVLCFVLVLYFYLSTSEKYQRNSLWVGMSKETAHQLGTPISSLMAWVEILREQYTQESAFQEIQKDVDRLEVIADRFSKIGSRPNLELGDLNKELAYIISYMTPRISPHVIITIKENSLNTPVNYSNQLFGWVIENLIKNAVDAMSGKGNLTISLSKKSNKAVIEIEDTGTGITKSNFKTIFQAGYSSKKRGWGLGLALVKRIIEEYHQGEIFVKSSTIGKGTIMRVEMNIERKK